MSSNESNEATILDLFFVSFLFFSGGDYKWRPPCSCAVCFVIPGLQQLQDAWHDLESWEDASVSGLRDLSAPGASRDVPTFPVPPPAEPSRAGVLLASLVSTLRLNK